MFGRAAEIPIASTFNELAEMDVFDYWGPGDLFAHSRYLFEITSRYFYGYKEKGRTNGENGERKCDFRMGSFLPEHRK